MFYIYIMGKRRSRRHRRRRGGVNSFEQIKHGADHVTNTVLSKPKEYAGAISGELKETPQHKVKRKAREAGGHIMGFLKKLKFWGGRRRTRRRRRHTRRCHHRRGRRHTKRCRRRRSHRRRHRRRH